MEEEVVVSAEVSEPVVVDVVAEESLENAGVVVPEEVVSSEEVAE